MKIKISQAEKSFFLEAAKAEELQEIVQMCDRCVGENLYSENEIRKAIEDDDSYIYLLKEEKEGLCGYVYFQKTGLDELAAFLKTEKTLFQQAIGCENASFINFRSIGIDGKMRNNGLSEKLFGFSVDYSEKYLKADYMFGAFWKQDKTVPMLSNLQKYGFSYFSTIEKMWYDKPGLICPVCGGRCICSAEIYFKKLKEDVQ